MLERYRHDPRIMWIGGTNPLGCRPGESSYFFNRINWMWGWATWRRAWQHYDPHLNRLPEFKSSGLIEEISPHRRVRDGFMSIFEMAHEGRWRNWDINATFTIWSCNGLAIHPAVNLITNIGFYEGAHSTFSADDPLANMPAESLGDLRHPEQVVADTDFDLRSFDTHLSWMNRYARFRRYQRLPFYNTTRSAYRLLKHGSLARATG